MAMINDVPRGHGQDTGWPYWEILTPAPEPIKKDSIFESVTNSPIKF